MSAGKNNNTRKERPVALVVLSGGGFTFETKCLLASMADDVDFIYIRTKFGGVPGEGNIPFGKSYIVPSFSTKTKKSLRRSIQAFVETFAKTLYLVCTHSVDFLVTVGCSHAVPMFLAGRLSGRNTVYVESITRVNQLSTTGKIVYYFRLSTIFIVQWADLQKAYPSSQVGSIL
jgi:UDP-N-acetylglucosamine:LPS N-acetylglucosamine transferase